LALHEQHIPCQVFESRKSDASELASGVVLTPNGLSVLSALNVFDRIKSRCWKSEFRTYKNDKDETTRKALIANEELYGYKNHRLYRRLLLAEMKLMLDERHVPIIYEAKFEGILTDNQDGVKFQVDGKEENAAMLIGADGIYSSIRNFLCPGTIPEYTGVVGVLSHIDRSTVAWPYDDYEKACTIQGKPGAIFMIPEVEDGSEIMVGMQVKYFDQSRAAWEALAADQDKMADFYRNAYDEWNSTARSIIDSVCAHKETLYLWPFLKMPKLDRWFSDTGHVIIIGDAAHAVPPSSGQGVNQALEDVYSLTQLLNSGKDLFETLRFWQERRQKRIDAVYDWATHGSNVRRLPQAERDKLVREGNMKYSSSSQDVDDMRWLYQHGLDEAIGSWVQAQG
jgi:2-polyprenyl-6-methoxyphenol hydroxylase-like FAD-dependent oxidoreductase